MTEFADRWAASGRPRLNTMFGETITFHRGAVQTVLTARVQRLGAGDFDGVDAEGYEADAVVTFDPTLVTGLATDPASAVTRYAVEIPVVVGSSTTHKLVAVRRVDTAGGEVSFTLRREALSQKFGHATTE